MGRPSVTRGDKARSAGLWPGQGPKSENSGDRPSRLKPREEPRNRFVPGVSGLREGRSLHPSIETSGGSNKAASQPGLGRHAFPVFPKPCRSPRCCKVSLRTESPFAEDSVSFCTVRQRKTRGVRVKASPVHRGSPPLQRGVRQAAVAKARERPATAGAHTHLWRPFVGRQSWVDRRRWLTGTNDRMNGRSVMKSLMLVQTQTARAQ